MIGKTISHYRILEEIGGGGMGVVYRAEDLKLQRIVALKFLPSEYTRDPEARDRFIKEAQAVSRLQHDSICTVHDIEETEDGRIFICMDFYEGGTLRDRLAQGPMAPEEASDIVEQAAMGLAAAHAEGMVHRDIKPANLLVTGANTVKIADFGLARLLGQSKITTAGKTVGTVPYMSPEQARGEEVDERSDLFSLAVVLYELLAGTLPFPGEHEQAVIYRILNEEPLPLEERAAKLPQGLRTILDRALQKDPGQRYQSAAEFLADLRAWREGNLVPRAPESGSRQKLLRLAGVAALLALLVWGGFHLAQRFGGAVDQLGSTAAAGEEEFVLAIAPFWGQNPEAIEEGRVMQVLVERKTLAELGHEDDVSILGAEISEMPRSHAEARELGHRLGATMVIWGEALVLRGEVEIQPYITVIKSFGFKDQQPDALEASLSEPKQLSLRKAKAEEIGNMTLLVAGAYYRQKDPAKALALLARILPPTAESIIRQGYVYSDRRDWPAADSLYRRAIALDPQSAHAHNAIGWDHLVQLKYEEGIPEFERAVEIDPDYAQAYSNLGWAHQKLDRLDQAIQLYEKAIACDPLLPAPHCNIGWVNYFRMRYEVALDQAELVRAIDPEYYDTYLLLGATYSSLGRDEDAIVAIEQVLEIDPRSLKANRYLGVLYRRVGAYDKSLLAFERSIELSPRETETGFAYTQRGIVHWMLDEFDKAVLDFETACRMHPRYIYNKMYYFLSLHLAGQGQEAQTFIIELAGDLEEKECIDTIIRYFAGEVDEESVWRATAHEDSVETKANVCEAFFYLGMSRLLGLSEDDESEKPAASARGYFQKCLDTDCDVLIEYDLASWQLRRLDAIH